MARFIAPSLLAADFTYLRRDIEMVNNSEAHWLHLDIMDGIFVPNISFGQPVVKAIKTIARKPLDVHLMIVEPEKYLSSFRDAGADILTVHIEACKDLHRTVQQVKELGLKAGVSLNPLTPVSCLKTIIASVDLVLIMSVNPGFGNQLFIETSFKKIRETKSLIKDSGSQALIEVDGGVNIRNAAVLFDAGVDIIVAGTAVFSAPDPIKMIHELVQAKNLQSKPTI